MNKSASGGKGFKDGKSPASRGKENNEETKLSSSMVEVEGTPEEAQIMAQKELY